MNSLVVTDKSAPTIVVTTSLCPVEKMRYLKQAGVQVMFAPLQRDHHIDLKAAIELLGKEGITGILVEGGSTVQGSFFDAKLVDKIYAFIGDKVIGGTGALPSVGGFGVDTLDECMPLQYDSIELTEGNILITAYNTNREGAYVHWNH
jgi:diaminohydroxyphosphoribosylaminopyrimidine deaminase/5-amino-6-(5-phosphoribosylamino)uracil reductase